jgi:hypothetical protein
MIDVFNFANPQTANYQEFYGGGTTATSLSRSWSKPRGASMVRMLLIGAGGGGRSGGSGGGAGGGGGGSGAVTEWIGPAIFIPDQLRIVPGRGGSPDNTGIDTTIIFQQKDGTGYTLLTASAGSASGGSASSNNFFGASGIFKSTAGQNGAPSGAITASNTIFLSGGAAGAANISSAGANVACNYGYPTITGGATSGGNGNNGYFLTQPIMIGVGGSGGGGSSGSGGSGGKGGIGSGGGGGGPGNVSGGAGGRGGDGAVFIWSW